MNFDDPEGFRAMLEARGLSVPLAHVPVDLLKSDFPRAVEIAHTLGFSRVIGPWPRPGARPDSQWHWRALENWNLPYGENLFLMSSLDEFLFCSNKVVPPVQNIPYLANFSAIQFVYN